MKLYRDKKRISNITIVRDTCPKKRVKIVDTSKILIFASVLALSYVKFDINKIDEKKVYADTISVSSTNNECEFFEISSKGPIIDECIEMCYDYSYVFNIKPEIVINEIFYNVAGVTKNELYKNKNIMGDSKIYDTLDMQVILLSKRIAENPSLYGYNMEDISLDEEYKSDLSIRQMVYKYADAFNIDRYMALAIACGESGFFTADIATYNKNPYSYRLQSGNFKIFDSLEQGILEGLLNLKQGYFDKGLNTYEKIEHIYCPDSINHHWINLMRSAENQLRNGKKLYDENNKKLIKTK